MLQQYEQIPHSRIYRTIKCLEERGLLEKKVQHNELGRPKYVYFLNDSGKSHQQELRTELKEFFTLLRSRYPEEMDFNINDFLSQSNFTMFQNPLQQLVSMDLPSEDILQRLYEMEKYHVNILKDIKQQIHKFETRVGDNPNDN